MIRRDSSAAVVEDIINHHLLPLVPHAPLLYRKKNIPLFFYHAVREWAG